MKTNLLHRLGAFPVKVLRGLSFGAWWSVYPHSSYWRLGGNDSDVEAFLRQYAARPGTVFWDIGAHYGIYSVGVARAVDPTGRVESFEPDPVSFRRLLWHRRLNRLPHLHAHEVAASDQTGESRLYQYDDFGATTSHLAFPGETTEHVPFRTIRTARLDEWVAEGRLLPPHCIKIDVEGHAVPALRGMRATLAQHLPVILLAVHTREEYEVGSALLFSLSYTSRAVSAAAAREIEARFSGELIFNPPSSPR